VYEIARHGVPLTWLPVDGDGRIDPDDVAPAISGYRAIVSVGWANNEIGTIQPIREIAEVCNQHGAVLHVDAVQAAGKIGIDFENLDLCSLSAHKLGGPKGVGALLVRKNLRLRPLMFGGPQERGRRPGTENVAGIVGFAAALALKPMGEHVELLRERLWAGVSQLGGVRNSPPVGCLPNTLNVAFEDLRGEAVVAALDLEGVAVSVGSACAAGSAEPSHVLRAIGRSDEDARAAIRFSLGSQTTVEEIDTVIEVLARVVERMRRVRGKQVAHG
jgi:cysteine desulfurase